MIHFSEFQLLSLLNRNEDFLQKKISAIFFSLRSNKKLSISLPLPAQHSKSSPEKKSEKLLKKAHQKLLKSSTYSFIWKTTIKTTEESKKINF
jgi:hypothetical protein